MFFFSEQLYETAKVEFSSTSTNVLVPIEPTRLTETTNENVSNQNLEPMTWTLKWLLIMRSRLLRQITSPNSNQIETGELSRETSSTATVQRKRKFWNQTRKPTKETRKRGEIIS